MALDTNLKTLRLANHDFCIKLYKELSKSNTGNMFYSPFSIHVIMFMASTGADSKTFDEITATLCVNDSNNLLEAYKKLLGELTRYNNFLKLATGMFVDTGFKIKQLFIDNSLKYLNSPMEKLNFSGDPETQRHYLNNWVLNNTNHKIKDLFPPGSIDETTSLVLANAMHFQSKWENSFTFTEDGPFYLTPDNKINAKMMNLTKSLRFYHDDKLQFSVLELPYKYDIFNMIILLPDAKDGLKNLEAHLPEIRLDEISNKLDWYEVNVRLPRFKLEQSFDLKETLSNLGCPTMFTPAANFCNIADDGELYVSSVLHKAYVDVDEKGTEAAAATGTMLVQLSAWYVSCENKVNFFVDCPFIFYILSKNHDLLFFGRVKNIPEV